MHGLARATVIDNKDPKFLMRLRVQILGLPEAVWALACLPAHIFTLPDVGAVVWVAQESNSTDSFVWLGVLPTGAA